MLTLKCVFSYHHNRWRIESVLACESWNPRRRRVGNEIQFCKNWIVINYNWNVLKINLKALLLFMTRNPSNGGSDLVQSVQKGKTKTRVCCGFPPRPLSHEKKFYFLINFTRLHKKLSDVKTELKNKTKIVYSFQVPRQKLFNSTRKNLAKTWILVLAINEDIWISIKSTFSCDRFAIQKHNRCRQSV